MMFTVLRAQFFRFPRSERYLYYRGFPCMSTDFFIFFSIYFPLPDFISPYARLVPVFGTTAHYTTLAISPVQTCRELRL